MHATPSEIAVTMNLFPTLVARSDSAPPPPLTPTFLRDHAGDNHWDAHSHRAAFPDGRVGSDSSLATPAQGEALLNAAIDGAMADYAAFLDES